MVGAMNGQSLEVSKVAKFHEWVASIYDDWTTWLQFDGARLHFTTQTTDALSTLRGGKRKIRKKLLTAAASISGNLSSQATSNYDGITGIP